MTQIKATQLRRGESIFTVGNVADAMYFVLKGKVELSKDDSVSLVGSGEVIGAVEFLNKQPYSYAGLCNTDTHLLVINEHNILQLFQYQPQVGLAILKTVAAGHKPTFKQIEQTKVEKSTGDMLNVLPKGHPVFEHKVSPQYEEYTFTKEVSCPICGNSFNGIRVRETRLKTEKVAEDFRVFYVGFEPLWFYIWVCPHCLFAHPYKQFQKLSVAKKTKLRQNQVDNPVNGKFQFSNNRSLNEVFKAYYLTLHTYEQINVADQQLGNLWLRLVWLYEDAKCDQWVKYAAKEALAKFEKALVSGWRSEAGDQKLYVVMAELSLRLGKEAEALRHLMQAVNMRSGNRLYSKQAADKIQDLRRIRKGGQQ